MFTKTTGAIGHQYANQYAHEKNFDIAIESNHIVENGHKKCGNEYECGQLGFKYYLFNCFASNQISASHGWIAYLCEHF
jgi:hypothetical protein